MRKGIDRIGHGVTVKAAKKGCFEKVRYCNKNKARDESRRLSEMFPDSPPQRPYRCSLCDGFHLTSQVPNGLKYRKQA